MAQHIPTQVFKQKRFRAIEEGIRKDVKRGYLKTSFKYESLPADYNNPEDDQVYLALRSIPKGIVAGTERGTFEIHTFGKQVNAIYLVA